ncbi:hypothetical protein O181_017857, partial [Austropuccinia psidii MF-1]|nr:hypothetical protein [Austropuccinia psidii MF-1]
MMVVPIVNGKLLLPTQNQLHPGNQPSFVSHTRKTNTITQRIRNNHPSGVRVSIHTPTQTPQISKPSTRIS